MSLASFHYAFDSRDELIDELITTVVAREQQAVMPATSRRARASRELLESGLARYFEHLKADPEHEQAMLELTQYALRSPERHPLALAQYARYAELAERSLELAAEHADVGGAVPVSRGGARARGLHRRTHPHLARRSRRRRRPGGRACGRRRPLENGRPPMTSLDPAPPVSGSPGTTDRSPRSPSRSAGSPPGGSARSRPSGSASGWPSSRPCSSCCPRRSTPSCIPRTGSTASSRSA